MCCWRWHVRQAQSGRLAVRAGHAGPAGRGLGLQVGARRRQEIKQMVEPSEIIFSLLHVPYTDEL